MKDIIQSLNLPKQIIDKTEEFMKTLLGPATKELGEFFADNMRYRRVKNQIDIFQKTMKILESKNLKPKQLNIKTLFPLLENSSLEEDSNLQQKWANLIANISTKSERGLEPRLVKTLSNITSLEANILDYAFDAMYANRILILDRKKQYSKYWKEKTIDDIQLDTVEINYHNVKDHFHLSSQVVDICIDNLILSGLIKRIEPSIDIDKGDTSGRLVTKENAVSENDKDVEFDIDVSATYIQLNDFTIAPYGIYFIECCKEPKG